MIKIQEMVVPDGASKGVFQKESNLDMDQYIVSAKSLGLAMNRARMFVWGTGSELSESSCAATLQPVRGLVVKRQRSLTIDPVLDAAHVLPASRDRLPPPSQAQCVATRVQPGLLVRCMAREKLERRAVRQLKLVLD